MIKLSHKNKKDITSMKSERAQTRDTIALKQNKEN